MVPRWRSSSGLPISADDVYPEDLFVAVASADTALNTVSSIFLLHSDSYRYVVLRPELPGDSDKRAQSDFITGPVEAQFANTI
jgi:hypothetical protein